MTNGTLLSCKPVDHRSSCHCPQEIQGIILKDPLLWWMDHCVCMDLCWTQYTAGCIRKQQQPWNSTPHIERERSVIYILFFYLVAGSGFVQNQHPGQAWFDCLLQDWWWGRDWDLRQWGMWHTFNNGQMLLSGCKEGDNGCIDASYGNRRHTSELGISKPADKNCIYFYAEMFFPLSFCYVFRLRPKVCLKWKILSCSLSLFRLTQTASLRRMAGSEREIELSR